MSTKDFLPGAVLRIKLKDGSYAYGRKVYGANFAFYNLKTEAAINDASQIVLAPIQFTVAVSAFPSTPGWEQVGVVPLETDLLKPVFKFWQNVANFDDIQIVDTQGSRRPATRAEVQGLERYAVWAPEQVEDRLLDAFLGRPNKWLESLRLDNWDLAPKFLKRS